MRALARKTYPAKPRTGTRKEALPGTLQVQVYQDGNTFHTAARRKAASGHSAAWAVRKLAELLGYSAGADVLYLRTDDDAGVLVFQIVEPMP